MERASSDIEGIAGYMQDYFKDCLYVPIIVIVFALYLLTMNPVLAAVCLGPLAIMVPRGGGDQGLSASGEDAE